MNSYRIALYRGLPLACVDKQVLQASNVGVAVKRYLDGGHAAGYTFAKTYVELMDTTVGPNRVKLEREECVAIYVTRL